jgi:O-acetylhomoserine (thiol)-lyase
MARHVENARQVASFLEGHPLVSQVAYPDLESHPDHALARRLLPKDAVPSSAWTSRWTVAAGAVSSKASRSSPISANVGDARSLVIPSGVDHALPDERRCPAQAGIGEGTLRLSIGLEDASDLIADLKRALKLAAS